MKNKIYYWGPFLDNVATIKAISNSVYSINRYSNIFEASIINAVGEWDEIKLDKKKDFINFINFKSKIYKKLPRYNFLKSRISYFFIFFKSFFPLKNLIMKDKPDYLIIHLIVSLPLILFKLFNFKTKLCLRISGKPKLNLIRKILWKFSADKIYLVFCPTEETKEFLIKEKIFECDILTLYDPVIFHKEMNKLKKKKIIEPDKFKKNNIIMLGRLTKQKNYPLAINSFKTIIKSYPDLYLNIFGEGELKNYLINFVRDKGLEKNIIFHEYTSNVFKYLKESKIFLLTSLWEDPGFVLIEAAYSNTLIVSSNCQSGPKEICGHNSGFLFENNSVKSLIDNLQIALQISQEKRKIKIINAKKKVRKFTAFSHFKNLEKYLVDNEIKKKFYV